MRCSKPAVSGVRPHRGDCRRSKYVTHWITLNSWSRWIFPYSLLTHTHTHTHKKMEQIMNKLGLLQMPAFSSIVPFLYYGTFTVRCTYSNFEPKAEQHSKVETPIFPCTNLYGITSFLCDRYELQYHNTWNWDGNFVVGNRERQSVRK